MQVRRRAWQRQRKPAERGGRARYKGRGCSAVRAKAGVVPLPVATTAHLDPFGSGCGRVYVSGMWRWYVAVAVAVRGGGRGGPGFPPPAFYGHSNTSLPTRDMKQSMHTRGHMNHKKAWKLPHAMHIQLY